MTTNDNDNENDDERVIYDEREIERLPCVSGGKGRQPQQYAGRRTTPRTLQGVER